MTVLITGGYGHIGRAVAEYLLARGDDVVVSDIDARRDDPLHPRACFLRCDVSDDVAVDAMVAQVKPTAIYHMAGLLNRVSEDNHLRSFDVNVRGSLSVFEAARRRGCARVFYASSRGTYGLGIGERVDDMTLQRPETFYGCGKLYIENLGRWYRATQGVDVRSIRYPTILAPGVKTKGHWAPAMIEDAIAGRHHRAAHASATDNGVFLLIEDAARATVELIEASAEETPEVNYNVTGLNSMTTAQEMAAFLSQRYPGFTAEFRAASEPRVTTAYIDDSRARSDWGWTPQFGSLSAIVDRFEQLSTL